MQWSTESRPYRGCDYWTGAYYCGVQAAPYVDDVTDEQFCELHAGPLGWGEQDVNLYSLALRVAGAARVPYLMPADVRGRLYPTAGGSQSVVSDAAGSQRVEHPEARDAA